MLMLAQLYLLEQNLYVRKYLISDQYGKFKKM